ncbi:RluA family pseudouridine synthase [Salegentibacter chungangensis]|uniref:RluA family pseudouridine synthase n=1 Tax=Salegentibacter chungangensis TaxID=1335724 RepID=A0ABW3NMV2_9FLAO
MKIIETHIVPATAEKIRLQEYAVSIFKSITTRSGIKKAIKKELILMDGLPAKTSDWIREGQKIELLQPQPASSKHFELKLEILYEDEFLALVNKPAGFPTSGNYFRTVQNALPYNLKASGQIDKLPEPLPAHRLDNPTSGILVCAKTRGALIELQKQFEEKKIQKIYTALVHGTPNKIREITGEIDGKPARTRVELIETYKIGNADFSLIKAFPETGRTHQIRIHLANENHPIVGDKIYGNEETGPFQKKNLFLFSGGISFTHPIKGERLTFELRLPKKFRKLKDLKESP